MCGSPVPHVRRNARQRWGRSRVRGQARAAESGTRPRRSTASIIGIRPRQLGLRLTQRSCPTRLQFKRTCRSHRRLERGIRLRGCLVVGRAKGAVRQRSAESMVPRVRRQHQQIRRRSRRVARRQLRPAEVHRHRHAASQAPIRSLNRRSGATRHRQRACGFVRSRSTASACTRLSGSSARAHRCATARRRANGVRLVADGECGSGTPAAPLLPCNSGDRSLADVQRR